MPSIPLSDLRAKVYDRIENNAAFYDQTVDVDNRINEALRISNLFCGWSQGRVTVGPTTAGRVFYRTPAGMLFAMKVYLDNRELMKDSIESIADTQPRWTLGSGTRAGGWMPIGTRRFAIFPADQKGGRILESWGVTEPPLLVNASDTSNLPDEQLELVIEYALMNLVLKEGGKCFSDTARLYKPWLKKMTGLQMWTRKINPNFQVEVKQRVAA